MTIHAGLTFLNGVFPLKQGAAYCCWILMSQPLQDMFPWHNYVYTWPKLSGHFRAFPCNILHVVHLWISLITPWHVTKIMSPCEYISRESGCIINLVPIIFIHDWPLQIIVIPSCFPPKVLLHFKFSINHVRSWLAIHWQNTLLPGTVRNFVIIIVPYHHHYITTWHWYWCKRIASS